MSQEEIEVVRTFADIKDPISFLADETAVEKLKNDLAEKVHREFHTVGASTILDSEGVDAFIASWRDLLSAWQRFTIDPEEIRDLGDGRILTLGLMRGQTATDGVSIEIPTGAIFTFRNGQLWRYQAFSERTLALEAAGLRE